MSEKTAGEVIQQICRFLESTGHLDNERKTALDMAYKSLNQKSTDLIQACIDQLEQSEADNINVSTQTKIGYKITVTVERL